MSLEVEMAGSESETATLSQNAEEKPPLTARDPSDVKVTISNKGNGPWDFVFVTDAQGSDKSFEYRKELQRELKASGLEVKKALSRDGDEMFFRVSAELDRLTAAAEKMKLELPLLPVYGGGQLAFTIDHQNFFDMEEFNASRIRQQIIWYIIRSPRTQGGAGIDVRKWLFSKKIKQFFAITEPEKQEILINTWRKSWSIVQPLDEIRDYFGEKIALYFAFLECYTLALIVPAVFGIVLFFLQRYYLNGAHFSDFGALYALLLSLWTTLFSEAWKRRNSTLALRWNVMDFEEEERERPEFVGDGERVGIYCPISQDFVPLDSTKYPDQKVPYFPPSERYKRYAMGSPFLLTLVGVVIAGTGAVLFFKFNRGFVDLGAWSPAWSVINAVFIIIMNKVYKSVASKLNDYENHRTDTAYEDALVIKVFLFQFVNSYLSLFYVAFISGGNAYLGPFRQVCVDSSRTTPSPTVVVNPLHTPAPVSALGEIKDACVLQLSQQLAIVFLVQIVWGQFQEIGIPFITSKVKILLEDRKLAKEGESKPLSAIERQSKLPAYGGVFDDYNEMLIQFGYVSLFAAAFPLAAVAALFNNVIEQKTDAFKVLEGCQRPLFTRAEDIGSWQMILEAMSVCAVVTNTAILCITTHLTSPDTSLLPGITSGYERIAIIIVLEHAIIALKFFVGYLIPDVPAQVAQEISRQNFEKDHALQQLTEQAVEDAADGDDSDVGELSD